MKKYPIGFHAKTANNQENEAKNESVSAVTKLKKSVVHVYFPNKCIGYSYYNDSFDLKVGDSVYVEGKLEGCRGWVTEVNYSFKIKVADYKKVIAVVDTGVQGDFYLAGSHLVTFDERALPFSKSFLWFKAPENEQEYAGGDDETESFSLDELSMMKITHEEAERGHDYYTDNRVAYLELNNGHGHAVVEGYRGNYENSFYFTDNEISNLKCTCFCAGTCKHEFAAILQLKETLKLINECYEEMHNGYFAIISKEVFMNTVMNKRTSGKITLEV